jgi:DNA-directed RNA polymerase specialized sigma24 family protein
MTFGSSPILPPSIIVQSRDSYSLTDEQRDVFESHRHHVFSVAYYMTGDEREAETILGATFVETLRSHPRPSIEQLDQSLMAELHSRLPMDPVPAEEPSAGSSLDGRNVRRTDLEEALWQLPARERLCFLLRDVEGYNPARIAPLLETTESDINRTVLSARLRIRRLLLEKRNSNTVE